MKQKSQLLTAFLVIGLALACTCAAAAAPTVYSLPIQGEIEPGLAVFVARGLALAERNDGVVLLEINTFGGRVDAATEIKDLIFRSKVPVIAYVSERAWSAGALIALAAPKIAMAPGSSMGAAEPRPMEEKTVSALRAEFEAAAERWGRDRRLAAAMVDASVVVEGLSEAGKILTLSAQDALDYGMADLMAGSVHEALVLSGYDVYELVELKPHWAENIARFLTNSTISSLLLTLGFLGLIFEITTPGWGVPGTAGLICLGLFFGGRYVAGLLGWEAILLFLVGLLLLLLELFVIPGFGIAGILGILGVFGSIILAFGDLQTALINLSIVLVVTIAAVILLWKRLSQSRLWKRLVLSHSESPQAGYRAPADLSHLVGKQGVAITPLRPSGTCVIDGQRYDVVSDGGFVKAHTRVEVVLTEGTRVVVREVKED
ncbi:MAG: NfeD family protein [Limnochordia bacterium]|jgi:membrane-bound serine protease (ClpP class)|nr:NfeD family protein [Limnochordia bacterium]MDI9465086.1 NfeD family protein [Bacillota bacterium]NLO95404.1 nodulation protein NfeD [Bacillota bacterium]HOB40079.1 NfeD family protein [Limnochordia bacterium]HOK31607.1 NfeD family protein [Limnochordia bacterium]